MQVAKERLQDLNNQIPQSPKSLLQKYRQTSQVNSQELTNLFFGRNNNYRLQIFEQIRQNPHIFKHPHLEEYSREEYRQQSFRHLSYLNKIRTVNYEQYLKDPNITTMMGVAVYAWNPSHCIKHGVHFYLYAKTIMNIGTEKHQKLIPRLLNLDDIGCFGLTELGHGSNVRSILTTATYDNEKNEFIINTPNDMGLKWWIGAAAQIANTSVIWAQLIVNGVNHGVHAFLVPIRNLEDHMPCPGVILGDCGSKSGLEGIDNGFLQFNNVRIPYDNLLDRFSQIENGQFKTQIKNPDKRFGLQLGSLSGGRVIISLQANTNAISALTIGIRYACIRQQFGLPDQPENCIIEYPLVQYRLITSLASVIVTQVAALHLNILWDENQLHLLDKKNNLIEELHAKSSVMKAISSWQAAEVIQICREILGGHGYSSLNRLSSLYRDNDINTTWEGDNTVLLQQTAKFLLDVVRQLLKGQTPKHKTVQFITIQPAEEDKWSPKEITQFKENQTIMQALEWRVNLLLQRSGLKLQENMQNASNPFEAWNETQVFYLNKVALAYGDVFQAQEFLEGMKIIKDAKTVETLQKVFELWGLNIIQKDLGTFREGDFVNLDQTKLIKDRITELIKDLKSQAVGLIDVLAPPDHILGAPFGAYDGDIYNRYLTYVKGGKNTYQRVNWWSEIHH